jgi:hypothetical protein
LAAELAAQQLRSGRSPDETTGPLALDTVN